MENWNDVICVILRKRNVIIRHQKLKLMKKYKHKSHEQKSFFKGKHIIKHIFFFEASLINVVNIYINQMHKNKKPLCFQPLELEYLTNIINLNTTISQTRKKSYPLKPYNCCYLIDLAIILKFSIWCRNPLINPFATIRSLVTHKCYIWFISCCIRIV